MSYKEEGQPVIEATPLAVGTGEVDLVGWKAKCPGFFVEVLRERLRFSNLG